jgi:hypothetical protein
MPRPESNQRLFELINNGNALMTMRVENKEAWCDLGYVAGMPEFTVVQLSFFGDYKITDEQLRLILAYVTHVVVRQ